MPQEIYNEGRVVGLSAWELFAKTAESNGVLPQDIPTESQWLASMIGAGSSMILRIPANTSAGVHDYELPLGSNLSAAGVIVANPFMGNCSWSSSTWATKVTSYGKLIENTSTSSPTSSTVPYTYTPGEFHDTVLEFIKITDGVVYTKNATWIPNQSGSPKKDIDPNFNESTTVIRLCISEKITSELKIIFTGFTNKRILQGLSGYAGEDSGYAVGGSTDTTNNDWANGGMLGPEIIPWASKIVFSVPSSAYKFVASINRNIPADGNVSAGTVYGYSFTEPKGEITPKSVIDFNGINITDYYTIHENDFITEVPVLDENVITPNLGPNDSLNTLVAWYPGLTSSKINSATNNQIFFPPALYAAQVTSAGNQTLVPMDTAAPGTIKGFENSTQAYKYKQTMPNNYAVYHNSTTNMFSFVTNSSNPADWVGTAKLTYTTAPKVDLTVANSTARLISLTNSSGTAYNTSGSSGTDQAAASDNNLSWDNLLNALVSGKKVDILGTRMHTFVNDLKNNNKIGIASGNELTELGTKSLKITNSQGNNPVSITTTVTNGTNLATSNSGTSFKTGTEFIEFSNGLRLYISNTAGGPSTTNVPVGSIGIGW